MADEVWPMASPSFSSVMISKIHFNFISMEMSLLSILFNSIEIKCKVINTCILLILTCGSQTWSLTKKTVPQIRDMSKSNGKKSNGYNSQRQSKLLQNLKNY